MRARQVISSHRRRASAVESPPRGATRWLAFLPSLLLFIVAARAGGSTEMMPVGLHDELIAAGFVGIFVALLWVFSRRLEVPSVRRFDPKPGARGFEVLPRGERLPPI